MNVHDLYCIISGANFYNTHFDIDVEEQSLFGFLTCDKDFIHASLPQNAIQDILQNNAKYVKCMYTSTNPTIELKNTLSLFTRVERWKKQMNVMCANLKGVHYYISQGLILDSNYSVLFAVCKKDNNQNKIIVAPKVFTDKTMVNKYITSKIIPEFATYNMEIDVKLVNPKIVRTGITNGILRMFNHTINDYKLCKMED